MKSQKKRERLKKPVKFKFRAIFIRISISFFSRLALPQHPLTRRTSRVRIKVHTRRGGKRRSEENEPKSFLMHPKNCLLLTSSGEWAARFFHRYTSTLLSLCFVGYTPCIEILCNAAKKEKEKWEDARLLLLLHCTFINTLFHVQRLHKAEWNANGAPCRREFNVKQTRNHHMMSNDWWWWWFSTLQVHMRLQCKAQLRFARVKRFSRFVFLFGVSCCLLFFLSSEISAQPQWHSVY